MSETIRFQADRTAYMRTNTTLAAIAMGGAMAVLWLIGEPHIWAGAVAALAAIGLRGWYLASEELAAEWTLSAEGITGPGGQAIALGQIAQVRTLASFTQIITRDGHKHLIKYQADPQATASVIRRAAGIADMPQ